MITVTQLNCRWLGMQCNYAYRKRCHDIPGAEFDYNKKMWVAPIESLQAIQAEFYDEIYWKTPLWKILGQSEPPKQELKLLGPTPSLPKLELTPFDYQRTGMEFMIDRINNLGWCMNGDAVGLGKTLESCGTMKWFVENRGVRKILITCKKSIKYQWGNEIRNITGWQNIPIYITGDTKAKRKKAYDGMAASQAGILITNYHNFLTDADQINALNFDLCILDEAHCVKRGKMNSLISETMRGKRTILLTGTPLLSAPDDIYGIVSMTDPNYFGAQEDFKERYIVTEYGIYGEQIVGAIHLNELREKIKKFYISRTAEEVDKDLPEVPPARIINVPMDSIQEKMYALVNERKEKLDQKKRDLLTQYGATSVTKAKIEELNDRGKMYIATLQFISDDPAVFRHLPTEKGLNKQLLELLPKNYKMSAKTEATMEVVSEILASGEKVIIFCHYASTARMLKLQIEKELGEKPVMYTGAEGDEQREKNIALFKEDEGASILIATEAAAEGLNLQVSRYILHFEQADTHAMREQRIGRIRRIGSKYKSVIVYDILTSGSFDEVKLRKIARDKELSKSILG